MSDPVPRVSIGLPVYNGERYLPECFDALLGQTFGDFELVVSDNASTDATEAICRDYAARDPRVRYHRQPVNRGAARNFNEAFCLSRCEYFKWAAYDDVCRPEFLSRCVAVLDAEPDVIWCHPLTRHIDGAGNLVPAEQDSSIAPGQKHHSLLRTGGELPTWHRGADTPARRFAAVMLGTSWCSDIYGLIRADALRQTRLALPFYGSEKVLLAELALIGRFAEIPEVLFLNRTHAAASGRMRTAAEQRRYIDTAPARRFSATRWSLLQGYRQAIGQSGLPLTERLRCHAAVARYVLQVRKWGDLARSTLRGASYAVRRPAGRCLRTG
jgi:glycosyltransferase involved in cell wall biosynthesis